MSRWTAAIRLCRIVTGVVLLWAGLAKVGDVAGFAEQVHNFRLLPVALENLAAITLPWIEIVAGLCLVANVRGRAGALLATALLACFTLGVAAAVLRGLDIECGCFGTADASSVGVGKILENLGLIAVGLIGCRRLE